jgi:site-specific recombinase XerD
MMNCIKCKLEIPDGSAFCCHCGASQKPKPQKKRGNGQGCVYKRGDTWTAEITLGYVTDADGHKKRRNRRKGGFTRKKDAIAYLEVLRQQETPKQAASISDLYLMWHADAEKDLSDSKLKAYEIAWRKIAPALAHRSIGSLSVPELQAVTDTAASTYYPARDIKHLISHLYKLAIRDDITDKNRAQYIRLPDHQAAERTIFTEQEIDVLWSHQDQPIAQHMLVMIYTGMRPAEILSMQKENIHLSEHYMTGGVKTKKSKARKIIIPDRIQDIIQQMLDASDSAKLTTFKKHAFYDAWELFRAASGLRDELTPYCCRHTYITMLTALKVSPAMLQELAGHKDYDTTLEYTHLSVQDRLNEVNRL